MLVLDEKKNLPYLHSTIITFIIVQDKNPHRLQRFHMLGTFGE